MNIDVSTGQQLVWRSLSRYGLPSQHRQLGPGHWKLFFDDFAEFTMAADTFGRIEFYGYTFYRLSSLFVLSERLMSTVQRVFVDVYSKTIYSNNFKFPGWWLSTRVYFVEWIAPTVFWVPTGNPVPTVFLIINNSAISINFRKSRFPKFRLFVVDFW